MRYFFLLALLLPCVCLAQVNNESSKPYERTLTGVVKEVSGETIPGATVQVKGHTNIVSVSDMYGNFVLKNIPSGKQTIVISFLGMESQEIAYTGQKSITVTMVEKANEIKDVVVTGIYVRKKSSFTGSASTYTKDELKKIGTKNLIQSLKTLEPSLNVVENSSWGSDPNRMPDMEIRGKTSIVGSLESDYDNTGNQPLFIVDLRHLALGHPVDRRVERRLLDGHLRFEGCQRRNRGRDRKTRVGQVARIVLRQLCRADARPDRLQPDERLGEAGV